MKVDEEREIVADCGINILERYVQQYGNDDLAIVFDIDDTLIDSRTGKAIKPMIDLYIRSLELGIRPFFITARKVKYFEETLDELRGHGIEPNRELYLVGDDTPDIYEDSWDRKANVRAVIIENGWNIVMNCGDDPKDFRHGFYTTKLKLPYV